MNKRKNKKECQWQKYCVSFSFYLKNIKGEKNMKVIKAKCPYCKTEHIIREVEVETELNMTRYRAEVNCDCGKRFFVDYNRKSLRNK
jgi:hypothetical protein